MTKLPAVPEEPRRRNVPKKIRRAVEALISGEAKTVTAAAKCADITREYLSRSLGQPHISTYFRNQVARALAMATGRAAARLEALIDAKSEHVSADVSKHVLAIAGIKPAPDANLNLSVEVKAGYIIDLREPEERGTDAHPMKIVSPA